MLGSGEDSTKWERGGGHGRGAGRGGVEVSLGDLGWMLGGGFGEN